MARLRSSDGSITFTSGYTGKQGTGDLTLSAGGGGDTFASPSVAFGTAFQPNATRSSILMLAVYYSTAQTDKTITVKMGPASAGTTHTIDTALRLLDTVGLVYTRTIPVPKGWHVKVTTSATTTSDIHIVAHTVT